jgi:hypothetical protein
MKHLLTGLLILFSSLAFSQGAWDRWVTTTGTNTYLASIAVPTFPSSYNNTVLRLKFPNGNTGASTINVNGVGAIPIRKWDGDSWEPLVSGDIPANSSAILYYDNTNAYYTAIIFESIGGSGSTPTLQQVLTAGSVLTGTNTITGPHGISIEAGESVAGVRGLDMTANQFRIYTDTLDLTNGARGFLHDPDKTLIAFDSESIQLDNTDGITLTTSSASGIKGATVALSASAAATLNTRQMVGEYIASRQFKESVRVASTANIADLNNAGSSIDGVTLLATNRVLLKDQSTASQNGIYIVSSTGPVVLSRANDFASSTFGGLYTNTLVFVNEGTAGSGKAYRLSTTGAITIGSTSLTFTEFGAGGGGTWGSITGTLSSQTDLQSALDLKGNKAMALNTQTTSYTLVLSDADVKAVEMNSVSSTNVTVPPNSSVAFPVGTLITVVQKNTGDVTIVAGSGVTITPPAGGNLLSPGQGQPMQLWQRATDDWYLWNGGEPIIPSALTKTDDTNVTLTLGGDPTNALLEATSLTLGWTGTLAASRGGTGGTAGAWPLTGTGTLTGATTIVGSSTNTIKYQIPSLGVTATDGAGLHLQNNTAAAAGAQQISPVITLEGNGWKTNATAASQVVNWKQYVLPVQGAANPTANLLFQSNVNGSTTGGALTLASDGARLTTTSNGLRILTNAGTFGGLSLDANAASSNTINFANTGFNMTNTAAVITAISAFKVNSGTVTTTSGNTIGYEFASNYSPASGTGTYSFFSLLAANAFINQTGGANGNVKLFDIGPTYTAAGGNVYAFDYHPTITSITGTHNAITIRPIAANSSFAIAADPTAKVHIGASTAAAGTASIKVAEGSRQTSAEDGTINYVSNNLEFVETSTVYILAKTLTNTATLDFPSTAAGTVSDLTITVTGAVDGDAVSVGVPNGSTTTTGDFSAWVSASNTVTVRFANNNLLTAQDPASGTFRVSVVKY